MWSFLFRILFLICYCIVLLLLLSILNNGFLRFLGFLTTKTGVRATKKGGVSLHILYMCICGNRIYRVLYPICLLCIVPSLLWYIFLFFSVFVHFVWRFKYYTATLALYCMYMCCCYFVHVTPNNWNERKGERFVGWCNSMDLQHYVCRYVWMLWVLWMLWMFIVSIEEASAHAARNETCKCVFQHFCWFSVILSN